MEIAIKGREYKRGNFRVSINLLESHSFGRVTYKIYEDFWGSDGKSNKVLRGVYDRPAEARIEYRRILHNLERMIPIRELDLATY